LLGADFSGDDDARFLREAFECGESVGAFLEGDDALNDAGAVAKDREEELAGFAEIVEPALNCDFLRVVLAGVFDVDRRHGTVCGAYLSRRGVWCEQIEYRALRVAGNCERETNAVRGACTIAGRELRWRGNGEVAQGIFGDGVGGIDCGADGGGRIAGCGGRGGRARSDEGGAGWGAVGVRCGACGWARGFDDDVF
jgi:hypothetical protein